MTRAPNLFAGPYVDRTSERRKDAAWVAAMLDSPAARFVPVWRHKNLLLADPEPRALLLERPQVAEVPLASAILLGEFQGRVTFALETAIDISGQYPASRFEDLRGWGSALPSEEAGLLAYARALVYWRERHRYCGACGSPTRSEHAGHVMTCSREACATQAFPRIDPAIIVLVTDGERALLGRQPSWPAGRYSTIAGFVEPGESLEDAVYREVREETNVTTTRIRYHSSQPWPFPSSLMLGFEASALTSEIACPDGELEDARWFTRSQVASGTPLLPPPTSISFRLIADWYVAGTGRALAEEPAVRRQFERR
jgi:NAD+ diphosphatase